MSAEEESSDNMENQESEDEQPKKIKFPPRRHMRTPSTKNKGKIISVMEKAMKKKPKKEKTFLKQSAINRILKEKAGNNQTEIQHEKRNGKIKKFKPSQKFSKTAKEEVYNTTNKYIHELMNDSISASKHGKRVTVSGDDVIHVIELAKVSNEYDLEDLKIKNSSLKRKQSKK